MVSQFSEAKDKPSYDLALLQRLAAADSIIYDSARNIENCLARLGYNRENLRACIGHLTPGDFQKSGRYVEAAYTTVWMDVYRLKCMYYPHDDSDEGAMQDDLYIKLSLSHNCVCVTVHSFHEWGRVL
jgi:hypothetical protein